MSVYSFYSSFIFFFFILGSFLWKMSYILMGVLMLLIGFYLFMEETLVSNNHYLNAFFMFLGSEMLMFFSLFTSCFWFIEWSDMNLSEWSEIPLFGSFLLLSSSLTVTSYHLNMKKSKYNLILTIILGLSFVMLQGVEFSECLVNMTASVYHASSFCTVGLHFIHVIMGLVMLITLLMFGHNYFSQYYSKIAIWYWHFVDYIWLGVYLMIYMF